jgi:hypothetical protein
MAYLGTKPANQVIDSTLIADGTITTSDLANNAVTQDKIAPSAQYMGFKNRIINGDMRIDQRNAGASVTLGAVNPQYTLDRWCFQTSQASKLSTQQNAGSIIPPEGFVNYLGITSLSSYSLISTDYFNVTQRIEGFNTSDLGWGTANAQTVTLSFWVYTSVSGTWSAALNNNQSSGQNYAFTYSVPTANTWTKINVTIPGSTSGSWSNSGASIHVVFNLGSGSNYLTSTTNSWVSPATQVFGITGSNSLVGTNGATFYVTGVQLEKGSVATSFDYRPYGTELALCQRYFIYPTWQSAAVYDVAYVRNSLGGQFPVVMRAAPSLVVVSGGMSGHHGIAPAAAGTNVFNANFDWTGSATRDGAVGVVTFTASAEL